MSKDNKDINKIGQSAPLRRIYIKNFIPYEIYINLAPVGDILYNGKNQAPRLTT